MDNVIVGGVGRIIGGAVKQHHCGGVLPGFVLSTAANKDMAGNLPSFRRRTILFREAAPPRIQKCKSMLEHDSLHTSFGEVEEIDKYLCRRKFIFVVQWFSWWEILVCFFRWRKFCSVLHENSTLCVTQRFGRQELTVPW